MRNNETGEFELVVGNRQLLSGFFIVVLLFGGGLRDGIRRGTELAALGAAAGSGGTLFAAGQRPRSRAAVRRASRRRTGSRRR